MLISDCFAHDCLFSNAHKVLATIGKLVGALPRLTGRQIKKYSPAQFKNLKKLIEIITNFIQL